MKQAKKYFIVTIFILFSMSRIQSQNSIVSSGSDAVGVGGLINYSVGQIVFTSNSGANGTVAQGVQQPIEISTELGIPEASEINLIATFPNPTISFVVLKIEKYNIFNLVFNLFDINGRLISNEKITKNETQIELTQLPSAIYFLKIFEGVNEIKTFKILKK